MRLFALSPRLRALANHVRPGARLADVGTDHARLPVWLIRQGVISSAIATDIRTGPLERARATAERFSVTDAISFRLCDGLTAVGAEEVDTIVMAGMGGETILQILEAAPWLLRGDYTLLLQPMSSLPDLRKWLCQHDFSIEQEQIVREGNLLYIIMRVKTGSKMELTLEEQWLGRTETDPLRRDYLRILQRRYRKVLIGLADSRAELDVPRREEMERVCVAIERELELGMEE